MAGKLKVVTCSMGGNIKNADFLAPIIDSLGMDFVRISEWPNHDKKWSRETWLDEIGKSDMVVCVARHDIQPGKSANRAVQAMALGKPILASPLPAYEEVIQNGINGFICRDETEWTNALRRLRDSEALRASVGEAARKSVQEPFSQDTVGSQWADLIKRQARSNCRPPKCDIIIPTWNNLPYLKLCIESIRLATDWPHNIIIVASGNKDGSFEWIQKQPDVIHVCSPERLHFSAANNAGLKVAKEKYVCLLNDDTIVGKGWLTAMMHEAQKPGIGAVGPFSNCDQGWLFQENIVIAGRQLGPGMKMEDVAGIEGQIRDYWHKKEVHARKWVAFYCALMSREAIDKVGLLDEGFKSGDEDLDYCKRLRDAGYRIVQTFDSWVFHYGGKTRKHAEDQNHALHHEEDLKNHAYFKEKWGMPPGSPEFRNELVPLAQPPAPETKESGLAVNTWPTMTDFRPIFGIYTGQGWERWSPKSLDEGGIGGSETCTIYTAREFARKGFRSVVFGDCEGMEGGYEGVEYIHYPKFEEFIKNNRFHLFVSSRRVDKFELPIMADRKACIVHDIWLSQDPNANLWTQSVDKFFVLSPWHRQFFLNHHKNADPNKTVVSRDGIDLDRFKHRFVKEPGRMVYSSSPDRGLDVLLECLPEIRKRVPHANVHVFYGFENWEKAVKLRGRPGELEWMNNIKARLDDPGVVYRGRIGQTQLAKEMMRSEVFAYPTYFCVTGDTLVDCPRDFFKYPDGIPISKVKSGQLVWTINEKTKLFELKRVKWVKRTHRHRRVYKLILDTGKTIRATGDHKFMRRDGSWAELKHLKPGDSLMALYRDLEPLVKVDPEAQGGWAQEYRKVADVLWSREERKGMHVHHKNERHADSSEGNLDCVTPAENFSLSRKGRGITSPHQRRRMSEGQRRFFDTAPKKYLKLRRKTVIKNLKKANGVWANLSPEERTAYWWKIHPNGLGEEALKTVRAAGERARRDNRDVMLRSLLKARKLRSKVAKEKRRLKELERKRLISKGLLVQKGGRWYTIKKMVESGRKNDQNRFYNHKVISVVVDGHEDVWDMEVSDNHNFISHGVVLHNCETFCMTGAEQMAAGNPVVTSDLAALSSTVGDAGILIPGDSRSPEYKARFVEEVVSMLTDRAKWEHYSKKSIEKAKGYSWEGIVEEWLGLVGLPMLGGGER